MILLYDVSFLVNKLAVCMYVRTYVCIKFAYRVVCVFEILGFPLRLKPDTNCAISVTVC
jgi:hypothetical protein